MFSGMYGCHTKCLSVSFFVNSAKIPNKKTVGIVGYGDCNPGPAWGFKFDDRDLVASVGSLITSHSGVSISDCSHLYFHNSTVIWSTELTHTTHSIPHTSIQINICYFCR